MGFQGYFIEVYIKMRRCPQPIISMIQGPACGGGFAFALASDVRIAADTAKMNAAFIKLGLSACDMGQAISAAISGHLYSLRANANR